MLALGLVPIAPVVSGRMPAAQAPPTARLEIVEQRQRLCCSAIAIDATGRLLATAFSNEVTLWDLETGLEVRTLVPRARAIARQPDMAVDSVAHGSYSGLAFDPSGRYVALTAVDNVNPRTSDPGRHLAIPHVWEVATGRDMSAVDWTYDAATRRTVSSAFPFDPSEVLAWQATTNMAVVSKLARYRGAATTLGPAGATGIGFVSEGGFGAYAYRLTAFDLDSNRQLWTIRHAGDNPPIAAFSPDGRWVAIASWNATQILDARTGARMADAIGANYGQVVAFSRDSRRLVVARQGEARVFSAPDWRVVAELRVPDEHSIRGVVFTPDDSHVIGVTDQAIHVWDTAGKTVRRFSMDGARPIQAMAVSPGGGWLAIGTPRLSPGLSPETNTAATVFAWPLSGGGPPRSCGPTATSRSWTSRSTSATRKWPAWR